jgi:hypothetical protein
MMGEIDYSKWTGKTVTAKNKTWREDTYIIQSLGKFSGLVALEFALTMAPDKLYLIGYDLSSGPDSIPNNIYKETKNYYKYTAPVFSWSENISKLIRRYNQKNVYRLIDENNTYLQIKDVSTMAVSQFIMEFKNGNL